MQLVRCLKRGYVVPQYVIVQLLIQWKGRLLPQGYWWETCFCVSYEVLNTFHNLFYSSGLSLTPSAGDVTHFHNQLSRCKRHVCPFEIHSGFSSTHIAPCMTIQNILNTNISWPSTSLKHTHSMTRFVHLSILKKLFTPPPHCPGFRVGHASDSRQCPDESWQIRGVERACKAAHLGKRGRKWVRTRHRVCVTSCLLSTSQLLLPIHLVEEVFGAQEEVIDLASLLVALRGVIHPELRLLG